MNQSQQALFRGTADAGDNLSTSQNAGAFEAPGTADLRSQNRARALELLAILPHPAATWSVDRARGFLNAAATELFGFSESEVSGACWIERIDPQDREEYRGALKRAQAGASLTIAEYRFHPIDRKEPIAITELIRPELTAFERGFTWSIFATSLSAGGLETKRLRELLLGLNHEVNNNLQVIKGEVTLLKIAGKISEQTCNTVNFGLANIKKLLAEMGEYLSPSPLDLNLEDPALVFAEVLRESERELASHQIRFSFVMQESLPPLPMARQVRNALREVIRFSCALLPNGGEVTIETALISTERGRELEIRVINASTTELGVEEIDVFRPFLNINGRRIGLSMAIAREILRRHSGKIVFCREHRNRAVFSIRLLISPGAEYAIPPTGPRGSKRRGRRDNPQI